MEVEDDFSIFQIATHSFQQYTAENYWANRAPPKLDGLALRARESNEHGGYGVRILRSDHGHHVTKRIVVG